MYTRRFVCFTSKALSLIFLNSENGCKNVQFHIQGEINDYTKEKIQHIVKVVADILDCYKEEILVNGVRPSTSFYLVLSLKETYTWKLSDMKEKDRLRLTKINIDFLIIDETKITMNSQKGNLNSSKIIFVFTVYNKLTDK